jgi:hypothetical protein
VFRIVFLAVTSSLFWKEEDVQKKKKEKRKKSKINPQVVEAQTESSFPPTLFSFLFVVTPSGTPLVSSFLNVWNFTLSHL